MKFLANNNVLRVLEDLILYLICRFFNKVSIGDLPKIGICEFNILVGKLLFYVFGDNVLSVINLRTRFLVYIMPRPS